LLRESFSEYFEYVILRLTFPDLKLAFDEDWRSHLSRLKKVKFSSYKGVSYDIKFKLINAADYGVAQTRERVFIVGIRTDLGKAWEFPDATHSEDRLLWDKFVTFEYWDRHNINFSPSISDIQIGTKIKNLYGIFPPDGLPWVTLRDILCNIPDPRSKSNMIKDHKFKDGAKVYAGHNGSHFDSPSKTIKAGGHGVPGGENMIRFDDGSVRYLTTFEAKLVQSFPADFEILGAWGESMRQIGNAVPVTLAHTIGRQLFRLLST